MVKFTTAIISILSAVSGVSAQTCVEGNYYCGSTLIESYGYTEAALDAVCASQGLTVSGDDAANLANYSTYYCVGDGTVNFYYYCGPSQCEPANLNANPPQPQAYCLNGPQPFPTRK